MEIEAVSTMELWKKALSHIIKQGRQFMDSDKRESKEVLNLKLTLLEPARDCDAPINRIRTFDEWVYPSPEEIEGIITGGKISPAYTYSYGNRVFLYAGTINQIDGYVVPLLTKDIESRRASIIVWYPPEDSRVKNKLVPGMVSMHFIVRDGLLHATAVIRSNDFFFGWPANIYQAYTLERYTAEKVGVKIGSITTISISAHIFHDELPFIERLLD